jgi:hypothetical protein
MWLLHKALGLALLALAIGPLPMYGQGVHAVVLEENNSVEVSNEVAFSYAKHRAVLIQNANGAHHANFSIYMSNDMAMEKFQLTLSDASGKLLRTFKQKDLMRTEFSEGLAADGYMLYLDVTPPSYPIVVTSDLKVDFKRNNVSFPIFSPLDSYNTEVEKATYDITFPSDYPLRYKVVNSSVSPSKTDRDGKTCLHFQFDNIKGMAKSEYGLPLGEVSPKVYFAPSRFSYFKTTGSLLSWNDLGKWEQSLFSDRGELPEEAKTKVRQLTVGCTTEKEKVAAIYKFLEESTRYVSIQLGIGGYQPMAASEVWRQGFGDCKALSNYMMALLAEVGIPSHCVAISTREKELLPDFPNFQQMNHMILEVPLSTDTLWIECTNPRLPLGYVHDDISGHEALEISAYGGKLVTLPEYPDSFNVNTTEARVALSPDGSADITINEDYRYHRYVGAKPMASLGDNDLRKVMFSLYHLPQTEIQSIVVNDERQPFGVPSLNYCLTAHSLKYASVTGSRLFVPTNLLHKNFTAATDSHLANELYIAHGLRNMETIVFIIPEGYTVESIPESTSITLPFAHFSSSVSTEGDTVTITYDYNIQHGTYPGTAEQFHEFEKKVGEVYGRKIVLKK